MTLDRAMISASLKTTLVISALAVCLQGCVAATVAGATVGVASFAVGTTAKVAGAAVGGAANVAGAAGRAVTGGGKR